jgi:hypothetical protein
MFHHNNPDSMNIHELSDMQQARQAEMRMVARLEHDLRVPADYGKKARLRFRRRLATAAAVAVLVALALAQFAAAASASGGGGGRPLAMM